jgi:glucose-1-phosphate adenylyltransferase
MSLGPDHRVVGFDEKPKDPRPMPGREGVALASMGIYVIDPEFLRATLERDAANSDSKHDFGRNIIPDAVTSRRVFAYPFEDVETKAQRYWRDVGTVDGYYNANMELIYVSPELNLYDEEWPIWTYQQQVPGAKFILDEERRRGLAINSMVAGGCIVSGAVVRESLLFTGVVVDEGTEVRRTVVLPRVEIGRSCYIANAIIDEGCAIPHGTVIGRDQAADRQHFHVTDSGVVLVTRNMLAALRRQQG